MAPTPGGSQWTSRHGISGHPPAEQAHMLDTLGYASLDELTAAALPPGLAGDGGLAGLPPAVSEPEALHRLRDLAAQNQVLTSMIGLGYYGTVTPAVIRRNILENPGWYTAYTPYQPEISQGRLEALLNFQTMVERSDRSCGGRGLSARRSHRGRGGDDPGPPGGAYRQRVPCRCPVPAADARGAGHPGGSRWALTWWSPRLPSRRWRHSPRGNCSGCCCPTPTPPGRSATCGRSSPRPGTGAYSPRSPLTCLPSPC